MRSFKSILLRTSAVLILCIALILSSTVMPLALSLAGDVNADSALTAEDLTVVRKALISGETDLTYDINGDGYVDVRDLVNLKKKIAYYVDDEKFEATGVTEIGNADAVILSELFTAKDGAIINSELVKVEVDAGDSGVTYNEFNVDPEDWSETSIWFYGTGTVTVTIYEYCKSTSVTFELVKEVKFASAELNEVYGNVHKVYASELFTELGYYISTGDVKITTKNVSGDVTATVYEDTDSWQNFAIDFDGTGEIEVTIEADSIPTTVVIKVDDVVKFYVNDSIAEEYGNASIITLGTLFYVDNEQYNVDSSMVEVTTETLNGNVSANIEFDKENWENSKLEFDGEGSISITIIEDSKPTTVELNVILGDKFELKVDDPYTVKNTQNVVLGDIFAELADVDVDSDKVKVTVAQTQGDVKWADFVVDTNDWTKTEIDFSFEGQVSITIEEDSKPVTLAVIVEAIDKFAPIEGVDFDVDTTVTLDKLFTLLDGVTVDSAIVEVTTDNGTYTKADDWKNSTITFTTVGTATVTIKEDSKEATVTVTVNEIEPTDKFQIKFPNTDTYLYRVGNGNAVALGSLFSAIEGADIRNVIVTVEALNGATVSRTYTANSSDWTKATIKFSGTGVVAVTIKDDYHCNELTLKLEVINAVNATTATSATSNDVVLLNDISGTFTVSGGHTFYGNGFKVTLPTASVQNVGQGFTGYISIGGANDDGNANGGNLDNVKVIGPVYPEMYIYRDQAKITDTSDPDYGDAYNMRYFKNSVIIYGGNCTISNSYISGSRTALCLRGGNNVVIENTTLSGGSYANMQICAGSSITLRDLTTVQTDVLDSYGKGKYAHGLGIAVDSNVVDIYIEGELNQYNWLNESMWNSIVPASYQSTFPKFFTNNTFSKYWHYLDGETAPYVNLAFIYACNWDTSKIHDNRTTVDYGTCDATIAAVDGGVYSKMNTVGGNAITDSDLADPGYTSTGFNPIAPVLNFDNTNNYDEDDANDTSDTYCEYSESSGLLRIGVSGSSKTIDLSGVSVVKNGITLSHTASLNGSSISGNNVTIDSANGAKQTLTFKASTNDMGYDKDGNPISGTMEYNWTVTVEIAVLAFPKPVWNMGGTYKFSTSNCCYAYFKTTQGYGEAVPIYEGIKISYYNKVGTLLNIDLSGTTTLPTGSGNSNSNAFTYTMSDGSILTMKFVSGWKSGATTHQFTKYNNKVYIYPQSLDNDNYVRNKTTNQDFDVKISYTFTDPNGQSTDTVTMQWYNAKASNGSVSTVQWKKFDSTNGKEGNTCVTPDTLVTLADGSQVRVDSLTGNEELLVWNHETGTLDKAPVAYIVNHDKKVEEKEILHLYFSNGDEIRIIGEHVFFDATLGKYVAIDLSNVEQYIGHKFVGLGDELMQIELVKADKYTEVTSAYEVVSYKHLTCFTNNILSTSAYLDKLLNIFDIDLSTMAYTAEKVQQDIETYGLYTYADFEGLISEEAFELYNAQYLKIAVGKGYITWDDILDLIDIYFDVDVNPIN